MAQRVRATVISVAVLSWTVAACASTPANPGTSPAPGAVAPPAGPKTITMAFQVFPGSAAGKLQGGGRGNVQFHWIFNAYLAGLDGRGTPQPMLADRIPTLEDGNWKVHPDGTMETIWTIRPTARWHDGQAITSRDFALAWEVINDREMPVSKRSVEALMSGVETPTELTLVIKWRQLFIEANALYGDTLPPLPFHVVEEPYRSDKQAFITSDFWSSDYVGSGPFKVEQWDPTGNLIVGSAHEGYALGRPQIDRLRIQYIADEQARITNVLAGTIDVLVSPEITSSGVVILKENWEAQGRGRISFSPGLITVLAFQFQDVPDAQRALRDPGVRRALAHAIDRQGIVDRMPEGVLTAAHYPIAFNDPFYPAVDREVPKREFSPPTAEQLLGIAGWPRAADGVRRSAADQRLDVPLLTNPGEHETEMTIVADAWKRVGVDASVQTIPAARSRDLEFRSTFRGGQYAPILPRWDQIDWISEQIPTRAGRFVGRNRGGYATPQTDALVKQVQTTLDPRQRERYAVELLRVWAEDVGVIPVTYQPDVIAAAKEVGGYDSVIAAAQSSHTWNMHLWTRD